MNKWNSIKGFFKNIGKKRDQSPNTALGTNTVPANITDGYLMPTSSTPIPHPGTSSVILNEKAKNDVLERVLNMKGYNEKKNTKSDYMKIKQTEETNSLLQNIAKKLDSVVDNTDNNMAYIPRGSRQGFGNSSLGTLLGAT